MTETRREHRIEQVAGQLAELMQMRRGYPAQVAATLPSIEDEAKERNEQGWNFDVRWADQEYINTESYTRVEGCKLSDEDLAEAVLMAERWDHGEY